MHHLYTDTYKPKRVYCEHPFHSKLLTASTASDIVNSLHKSNRTKAAQKPKSYSRILSTKNGVDNVISRQSITACKNSALANQNAVQTFYRIIAPATNYLNRYFFLKKFKILTNALFQCFKN